MTSDLVIKVFATKAICGGNWARALDHAISVLGVGPLAGEYVLDSAADAVQVDDLSRFLRRELPRWRGILTLVFSEHHGVSGRCDLLQIARILGRGDAGDSAGFRTHELRLSIPAGVCARVGWNTLFRLLCDISSELSACFSLGTIEASHSDPSHAAKGLESGIPAAYPMIVFGPEFVSVIGQRHLLTLPGYETRCVDGGLVGLCVDGAAEMPQMELVRRLEKMKIDVGEEFFSDTRPAAFELGGGQFGVWSLLKSVWRSGRDFESSSRLAGRRPELDWSGVFSRTESSLPKRR